MSTTLTEGEMGKTIALILAAGAGQRFGGGKQWYVYKGRPLLVHAIENCLAATCKPVWVVTGYESNRVAAICQAFGATAHYHSDWEKGMASSVNLGLQSILKDESWERVVVMAGDMPWFDPSIFLTDEVASIVENKNLPIGIAYPEGVGLPLLLPRAFVERHCYFVSQNEQTVFPLRNSILASKELITLPCGGHTKDVDRLEDLQKENLLE